MNDIFIRELFNGSLMLKKYFCGMIETDMKESGRMANNMVKVGEFILRVLILTFLDSPISKFF